MTGSSSQTYQLPDATTLPLSSIFEFDNNSSSSLIIANAGSTTQYTVPAGGAVHVVCVGNGTTNGTWDFHALTPATVTWGSGVTGLVMNSVLSTTPAIAAGASSSTAPSFIPQRGTANTGFGGDATNVYGIVGGVARFTANATGITTPGTVTGSNLSGTNTGDQTSIVGITGTLAEFNTALTGADFATGGGTVSGTSSGTNT